MDLQKPGQCAKILKELEDGSQLASKSSGLDLCQMYTATHVDEYLIGKQTVYFALQQPVESVMCTEETPMSEEELAMLQTQVQSLKSREKALKTESATLCATLTVDELGSELHKLREVNASLTAQLQYLDNGAMAHIPPEEAAVITREWAHWGKEASTRKRHCLDLWEMLSEAVPEGQNLDELWVRTGRHHGWP